MMHRSSVTGLNRDNRLPAHEYTIHLVSKVSSLVFRMHVPYVAPAGSCTSPDTQPYSHGVGPAYSTVRALRYFPSRPHIKVLMLSPHFHSESMCCTAMTCFALTETTAFRRSDFP